MSNINITVSGSDNEGKDLVANIISRALNQESFSNVALVNTIGEPMAASDVPSVMDQIKDRNPEFFDTPVRIWTQEAKDPIIYQSEILDASLKAEAEAVPA